MARSMCGLWDITYVKKELKPGARVSALSYEIVWGRTKLKTNARALPNDPIIERAFILTKFLLCLKVGYSVTCLKTFLLRS